MTLACWFALVLGTGSVVVEPSGFVPGQDAQVGAGQERPARPPLTREELSDLQTALQALRDAAVESGRRPRAPGGALAGLPAPTPKDSTGLVPLTDLGQGLYKGKPGGLYPGGRNERPEAHEAVGLRLARAVRPLDAEGKPAEDGKVVLLSIGMSNATQEFSAFQRLAANQPGLNPKLVLVDGAQGGMTAGVIAQPEGPRGRQFWATVGDRLKSAGVTLAQVQAAWVKEADPGPTAPFPDDAQTLSDELAQVARLLHDRFPNLKLAYLSSRTYGGFATTPLNPEPWAYQSGFAVKWLIEAQIAGSPDLNFDPERGPVRAPWLAWGPYLWADGVKPRGDGLTYAKADFGPDGTHPSNTPGRGREKVGRLLLDFFKSDPTTRPWFLGR
jgi:hypothetical protein